MATFNLTLTYNITTGTFVESLNNPIAINPPVIVYGDTSTYLIYFVRNVANPEYVGEVEVINTSTGLLVSVASAVGGTVATSATATGPNSDGSFNVTLPYGVAGILAMVGSTGVMEFKTGPPFQSFFGSVRVSNLVNSGTVTDTPVPDTAIGRLAALSMFVPKDAQQDAASLPSFRLERSSDGTLWSITRGNDGLEVVEKLT